MRFYGFSEKSHKTKTENFVPITNVLNKKVWQQLNVRLRPTSRKGNEEAWQLLCNKLEAEELLFLILTGEHAAKMSFTRAAEKKLCLAIKFFCSAIPTVKTSWKNQFELHKTLEKISKCATCRYSATSQESITTRSTKIDCVF